MMYFNQLWVFMGYIRRSYSESADIYADKEDEFDEQIGEDNGGEITKLQAAQGENQNHNIQTDPRIDSFNQ